MPAKLYPVTPTALSCNDYTVIVNGIPAAIDAARVSAMPLNRRWPGHQREVEQSEVAAFLSLAVDGPTEFEIIPAKPFDAAALRIRPRSLGITPTVTAQGSIRFTLPHPAYFTVEPYGRSHPLHIFADPMPAYETDEGAEVLYFGAGEHDVGQIELHSNQTLFLDEGAVVYACVSAKDAQHIRILGRGILDNSRNREKILFEANAEGNRAAIANAVRQHTVQLEYCTDVYIDGITIRDSLVYNIRPVGCTDLTIRHVKIIGCWRYNSDGIDMHNCKGVRISDCFLRTFDDSICVKGFDCYYDGDVEAAVAAAMYRNGMSYDTFSDVIIERCVIWNDWGKSLEIGAETRAEEIFDVCFRNCDIIHLTGAALDCMNVDYADVHHVCFEDIRIEADETVPKPMIQRSNAQQYENTDPSYLPYTVYVGVEFHHEYSAGGGRRGKNRQLRFCNIHLYSNTPPRVCVRGYDAQHRSEDIEICGLYWNDRLIRAIDEVEWDIGEYAANITLTVPQA